MKSKVVILSHTEIGDGLNHTPILRYLSKQYDEVIMMMKDIPSIKKNVPIFIEDCKNVKFDYIRTTQNDLYSNPSDVINCLNKYNLNEYELLIGGIFKNLNGIMPTFEALPYNFYDDFKIPRSVFWTHMIIPRTDESMALFNHVKDIPYYFITTDASDKKNYFSTEQVESVFSINRDETLIINSDKNIYPFGHKFFEIANQFVMKRVIDYTHTLENAKGILITNSCIFCLALHLPNIQADKCFYTGRTEYFVTKYLYKSENGFEEHLGCNKFEMLFFYL